jgi:hypothetical protein
LHLPFAQAVAIYFKTFEFSSHSNGWRGQSYALKAFQAGIQNLAKLLKNIEDFA